MIHNIPTTTFSIKSKPAGNALTDGLDEPASSGAAPLRRDTLAHDNGGVRPRLLVSFRRAAPGPSSVQGNAPILNLGSALCSAPGGPTPPLHRLCRIRFSKKYTYSHPRHEPLSTAKTDLAAGHRAGPLRRHGRQGSRITGAPRPGWIHYAAPIGNSHHYWTTSHINMHIGIYACK